MDLSPGPSVYSSICSQACADPAAVRSDVMADSPLSYAVGVVAVALDSLLSGFATVYFEKVHTRTRTRTHTRTRTRTDATIAPFEGIDGTLQYAKHTHTHTHTHTHRRYH